MPPRKCTEEDISDVALLCARACAKDALLGDLMHPHRERYPEDFVEHFRRRLNRYLHDSTHYHVVTYETYEGEEMITGYADWLHRDGRSEEPHNVASNTDSFQNRAADPKMADVVERAERFTMHYWTGPRARTWLLDFLMVDPAHQRKGFGRELVCFGLDLATRDCVCASVIASEVGEGLYVSCGFKPVGWVQEGEGNPLSGLPGGRILFRD